MARSQVHIKDVAREAGVSITTVSHALNGARPVSEESRRKVVEAANRLGYRPNQIGRALRSRQTRTLGFISDQVGMSPYAGDILLGAQQAARRLGCVLMAVTSGQDRDLEREQVRTLLQYQVDGIIYARLYHQVVTLPEELAAVPVVVVNAREANSAVPWVIPDEVAIGRDAVSLLVSRGHRRIAFAQNNEDIPATWGRLQGYQEALADAGIPFDPKLVKATNHATLGGYEAASSFLEMADPPTAVFCFSDRVAMGVYQAAAEHRITVGRDVSVVGVDNLEVIAPNLRPGLTTIELPHAAMGVWGVETLSRLISGEDLAEDEAYVRWKCRMIERESVCDRSPAD